MEKLLKNTRLLVLFTMLILVAGLSALSTLPRAEDPPLINRWATITTAYPGASRSVLRLWLLKSWKLHCARWMKLPD